MLRIARACPLRLRLYAKRGGDYYDLFVFAGVEEMRLYAAEMDRNIGRRRSFRHTLGLCQSWRAYRNRKRSRNIGYILLCRQHLGVSIVAHELTHAALYAVTGGTAELKASQDEKLAWLVGYFVHQFWTWYWKQKGAR